MFGHHPDDRAVPSGLRVAAHQRHYGGRRHPRVALILPARGKVEIGALTSSWQAHVAKAPART